VCAFFDPQESGFYGTCVEDFLVRGPGERRPGAGSTILEFGVGSGQAVCEVLTKSRHLDRVHGYESDPESCRTAVRIIDSYGLRSRYRVHNVDFFDAIDGIPDPVPLIANPPYLPSEAASSRYPVLSGGPCGNGVTNRIIGCRLPHLMLMISSYSDPMQTLRLAAEHGYDLLGWNARVLPMGSFSNRSEVQRRIHALAVQGRAFVRDGTYLLVGAIWARTGRSRAPAHALAGVLHSFRDHGGTVPCSSGCAGLSCLRCAGRRDACA
jgi:hypothetical protein